MMLKAPFPYFGGKSRVAREVWRRLALFVKRAVAISRMTPRAFSGAFCRPFLGFTLTDPCLNSAILKFMSMQIKVLRTTNGPKIINRIIQFVAINMMNVSALWNKAMMRFPYHMGTESPFIRRGNFHISALLTIPLVPRSYSHGSDWIRVFSGNKLTFCIAFHSLIISSNYVGGK